MPIKSRRFRKRNNKSRRTRKNKTTRRYKMKGGNNLIKNEEDLRKSWNNKSVQSWLVNDGVGHMTSIFREDAATNEIMPYEKFKEKINYYLKQVKNGQKDAYIREIY